jgi:hypothetical protein
MRWFAPINSVPDRIPPKFKVSLKDPGGEFCVTSAELRQLYGSPLAKSILIYSSDAE